MSASLARSFASTGGIGSTSHSVGEIFKKVAPVGPIRQPASVRLFRAPALPCCCRLPRYPASISNHVYRFFPVGH